MTIKEELMKTVFSNLNENIVKEKIRNAMIKHYNETNNYKISIYVKDDVKFNIVIDSLTEDLFISICKTSIFDKYDIGQWLVSEGFVEVSNGNEYLILTLDI